MPKNLTKYIFSVFCCCFFIHAAAKLPGTMEENRKGNFVEQATASHLNQTWKYIGAAWYQKEIEIPESWRDKQLKLFLERTKVTQVWIEGQLIGKSTLLSAPQVYNLTGKLNPGKHTLTIMVDNSPKLVSVGGSHALSDHTQTNWNGIIGEIYLQAVPNLNINKIRLTPDVKNKAINVELNLLNAEQYKGKVTVEMQA